jgi:hypothetical protein
LSELLPQRRLGVPQGAQRLLPLGRAGFGWQLSDDLKRLSPLLDHLQRRVNRCGGPLDTWAQVR